MGAGGYGGYGGAVFAADYAPIRARPLKAFAAPRFVAAPLQVPVSNAFSVEAAPIQFLGHPSTGPAVVAVDGGDVPVEVHFRSTSSRIRVRQFHHPSQSGEVQHTQSEDEPHILRHTVTKPVIQEVHEVIAPIRKITQEVQPVQEEINTIVAKNAGGFGGGAAGFGGGAAGLGGGAGGFGSGGFAGAGGLGGAGLVLAGNGGSGGFGSQYGAAGGSVSYSGPTYGKGY